MNEEEIAYKLIELYYTNHEIFKSYCIRLKDIADDYNQILKNIKIGSGE